MISGTTTTIMLRSGVARSCSIQPQAILLRTSTTTATSTTTNSSAYPYSTFPTSPFAARSKLQSASTRTSQPNPSSILYLRAQSQRHTPSTCRSASNSAHEQDAAAAKRAAQRAAATVKPGEDLPPLDWNTFFQLRKSRRRWQVAGSATMSLVSGAGGAVLLSSGAVDSLTSSVPLDPVVTMGLMFIGFVALGWLVGPTLGNTVFYLLNRKYKKPMTLKESQFFARIKKNRVDPSNSSTGNPVPDFYGEKISSVAGYRQWLKDQRAYNKKRTTFI